MPHEYTIKQYIEKAAAYCAYQERSEADVVQRLRRWDLNEEEIAEIILTLKKESFFSDERFAEAYARGKHRQNKWGRYKIKQGLFSHGITDNLAERAINSLPSEQYLETLDKLLIGRINPNKETSLKDKSRIFNYLRSKGYESDLIQQCWEGHLKG